MSILDAIAVVLITIGVTFAILVIIIAVLLIKVLMGCTRLWCDRGAVPTWLFRVIMTMLIVVMMMMMSHHLMTMVVSCPTRWYLYFKKNIAQLCSIDTGDYDGVADIFFEFFSPCLCPMCHAMTMLVKMLLTLARETGPMPIRTPFSDGAVKNKYISPSSVVKYISRKKFHQWYVLSGNVFKPI